MVEDRINCAGDKPRGEVGCRCVSVVRGQGCNAKEEAEEAEEAKAAQ